MATQTTNFNLNKPLVNDPVDEDLWGGQLNTNMDSIDDRLTPTGAIIMFAGTTAPNADWLLCDGAAVSRTTFAALFTLVSTSFGIGDGSTTFNVPDLRGRAPIGLDNLGSSSANRITDVNADSLNNTGGGDEAQTPAGTNGTTGATTLTAAQIPALTYNISINNGINFATGARISNSGATDTSQTGVASSAITTNAGGGNHTHAGSTFTGNSMDVTQPWLALGAIIKT